MSSAEGRGRRLSAELELLAARCRGGDVTFRSLLPELSPRDQAFLTLFISLCFLHPFPMPGLSTLLGAVIFIAGSRMFFGLGPWIPRSLLDRPLPARALERVFSAAGRGMLKLERLSRPRGSLLVKHPWVRSANGAAVAACGLLILLPLPPPTNFPPATALLLLSIGILEEDSLVLAFGYLALVLNVFFFGAVILAALAGLRSFLA